jgi:conjugal transfer mating pair stabilization protein TraG
MSNPDIEIITYGGGDLLMMVFNAIAMLFYGSDRNSSFVQPLCVISATIGGAWAISRCFFQSYADGFLTKFFFPLLAVPTLFIVPQARVHIIDKIDDKPIVVDHVPLLFAKIAGFSSYWGYEMTQAIEKVMHTPNDAQYSKTGMIFGADTLLDFSRLKLNNATLAQNLNHFTQQCIIYDIALGKYTIDQLRKSSNLLDFLKENTSKVRMIPYVDPESKQLEFLSCVDSVEKMDKLFDMEMAYYTKHEILKKLPISYQTLLSFQSKLEGKISSQIANASSEELCKDIIVVNAFNDASARFATTRARDNQRAIYQTAGSIAGSSLVTMRIIFEALIYASCAFILPLSMLPGGFKFISSWVFLNIWIQLWPPLYAILNYITMICAQKYAQSITGDLSNGFSLFTSEGFQDLALDTAALGGYLSLSVPIMAFYLLQNIQSIVHLSSSLMAPAHSAVTTAAGEASTGNYSFANTSVGQMSYENQTAFQQNTSPSLSSGFFTDNYGTHQVKYGDDGVTVNQDLSNLNTGISTVEAYSNSLQNAMQNAQTQVESKQESYTETKGLAARSGADLIQHIASSDTFSSGYSTSETQAAHESANWVMNATKNWGHQHGLSERESLEYYTGMGLDGSFFVSARAGHNESCNVLSDEARQSAENLFKSQDFQEHYQRAFSCTHNDAANTMTDEGKRFAENYSTSSEQLKSSQEQFSIASNELNQISENLSYVQSHTSSVNTNLNTDFSNWLHDRGSLKLLFDKGQEQELNSLRNQFIAEKCQSQIGGLKHFKEPNSSMPSRFPSFENEARERTESIRHKAAESNLSPGIAHDSTFGVVSQYEAQGGHLSHKLGGQQVELNAAHQNLKTEFDQENEKLGLTRLNNRFGKNVSAIFEAPKKFAWFDDYANPK